jgi:hypothetical protein
MLLRYGIIRYNIQGQRLEGAMPAGTNYLAFIGYEILTPVVVKIFIFWDIGPCSP